MATFDELREQAELAIRGQGRTLAPDDIDFAEQAADLLAALRLWAEAQDRTEVVGWLPMHHHRRLDASAAPVLIPPLRSPVPVWRICASIAAFETPTPGRHTVIPAGSAFLDGLNDARLRLMTACECGTTRCPLRA